jgi:outer membrane murein-binding lipoprotein Lpp
MEVEVTTTYLLVALLSSSVLGGVVALIGQLATKRMELNAKKADKDSDKEDKNTDFKAHTIEALRGLYYDKIKYLGKRYISERGITFEELRDIEGLHSIYKNALDGDGFLDSIMNDVHALRIVRHKQESESQLPPN